MVVRKWPYKKHLFQRDFPNIILPSVFEILNLELYTMHLDGTVVSDATSQWQSPGFGPGSFLCGVFMLFVWVSVMDGYHVVFLK